MKQRRSVIEAIYANRMNVLMMPEPENMAKLSFGESAGDGDDVMHTAIAMSMANARALHALLGNLLAGQDAKATGAPTNVKRIRPGEPVK